MKPAPYRPAAYKPAPYKPSYQPAPYQPAAYSGVSAHVEVLVDATLDHRPILSRIGGYQSQDTQNLLRRNFKSILRDELEVALELWPWATVHDLVNLDEIHQFVTFVALFALVALTVAAPDDRYRPTPYHAAPHHSGHSYHEEPAHYLYGYDVQDEYAATSFRASEARDGYATNGVYIVLLPDGHTQTANVESGEIKTRTQQRLDAGLHVGHLRDLAPRPPGHAHIDVESVLRARVHPDLLALDRDWEQISAVTTIDGAAVGWDFIATIGELPQDGSSRHPSLRTKVLKPDSVASLHLGKGYLAVGHISRGVLRPTGDGLNGQIRQHSLERAPEECHGRGHAVCARRVTLLHHATQRALLDPHFRTSIFATFLRRFR
eukprot:maker-scaffold143_size313727-snap-gene-2.20 protein:Tk09424 transcript:maker-scaffold143_size313727-snap-gene-2.20-mRNA-1 annotation:"MIP16725p"